MIPTTKTFLFCVITLLSAAGGGKCESFTYSQWYFGHQNWDTGHPQQTNNQIQKRTNEIRDLNVQFQQTNNPALQNSHFLQQFSNQGQRTNSPAVQNNLVHQQLINQGQRPNSPALQNNLVHHQLINQGQQPNNPAVQKYFLHKLNINQGLQPNINQGQQPNINQGRHPNINQGKQTNFIQGQQHNINQGQQSNINQGQHHNINQGQQSNINQGQQTNINQGQHRNNNKGQQTNTNQGQNHNTNQEWERNNNQGQQHINQGQHHNINQDQKYRNQGQEHNINQGQQPNIFQDQHHNNQGQERNYQGEQSNIQQRNKQGLHPNINQQQKLDNLPDRITNGAQTTTDRPKRTTNQGQKSINSPSQSKALFDDEDDRPVWGDEQPKTGKVPTGDSITARKIDEEKGEEDKIWIPKHLEDILITPSLKYCFSYCPPLAAGYAAGGVNAKVDEFPHMTALGFGSGTLRGKSLVAWNNCGGTLISKNFILTAAHCLDSDHGPPSQVRIGENDLSRTDEGAHPQDFPISRIFSHPLYNSSKSLYHDIALLQLARNVNISNSMRPACLHQGSSLKKDEIGLRDNSRLPKSGVATGWGNMGFADFPADILQKVELDIIDHKTCHKLFGSDSSAPSGIQDSTQVCAGVLAGGIDTCTGDSGGPLQINNTMFSKFRSCPMEILGITSFGRRCAEADSPGVYTRVSAYIPWIESIVWPRKA